MAQLTGTIPLTRAALRRDRVMLAVWVLLLTVTVYASAAATDGLYPSVAERVQAAQAINDSGAVVALYGPINDVSSLGEFAMMKLTVLYAVVVALLMVILVRRHTRGDEESGVAELLGGTGIGRDALLAAAVLEAALVAVVVGFLAVLADIVGGLPALGSALFGASWAGVGLVGVGITAVACQLSASSRTCAAIAGGAIGTAYAVRAVADIGPGAAGWLGWLSPLGWSTRLHAWHEPRWWVLGLYLVFTLALVVTAVLLRQRRDLGSGVFPARPGPSEGAPRLADAFALSWRIHRLAVVSWSAAVLAMGLVFGAITPGVKDLLNTEQGRALLAAMGGPGALEDALLSAVLALSGVVISCFGLAVLGHTTNDERDGRTEQVLATAVPRSQAFLATVVVVVVGSAWLLLLTGWSTGIGLGRDAASLAVAGLAQAPAVWTMLGIAVLLAAIRPGWAALGWLLLVVFLLLDELADLLSLPTWLAKASPFAHASAMPSEPFDAASALGLTAIAAVLFAAAWWRYRERDIG